MTNYFLSVLLIFSFSSLSAQNMSELERRNGFKDIKLGIAPDSLKGLKFKKDFKEKEEFEAKLYAIENEAYAKIGEVNVDKIEIKTYKNQIYQIHVVADKDTRLMKALESIYGKSEYDMKRETYFWKGSTLILKFKSQSKTKLQLIYTSYAVLDQMQVDKNKKVQDIADDF
jgi:hypothetical protein